MEIRDDARGTTRTRLLEAAKAISTLALLLIAARLADLPNWHLVALWSFMSLWAVRTATFLYRATHRSDIRLGAYLSAGGAACMALTYGLDLRSRAAALAMVAAVAFIGMGAVIITAGARRLRNASVRD
jgi:hypothetical protein